MAKEIMHAVGSHQLKTLVSLLADVKDVNFFISCGNGTPLHLACRVGFLEGVKVLVNHGADVNSTIGCIKTPLIMALDHYEPDTCAKIVSFLCDHGANIHTCATRGRFTALHYAAIHDNVEVAKELVKRGAKIHERMGTGWTPFQYSFSYQETNMMYYFLSKDPSLFHVQNSEGRFPIHVVRDPNVLAYHLSRGADVNLKTERDQTILHRLCYECADISLLQLVLDYGADINGLDVDQQTPFAITWDTNRGKNKQSNLQFLLCKGANPCIGTFFRPYPLASLRHIRKTYKANACIQLLMCVKRKKVSILQQLPVDLIRMLHFFLKPV